jgi:Protein of unknown function with HXXEE motif
VNGLWSWVALLGGPSTSPLDGASVVTHFQATFLGLVVTQAAHSIEEYFGRLYEVFPPARFVSGLISQDLQLGFIIFNVALVGFGVWCWLSPVRRPTHLLVPVTWFWIVLELANGTGHLLWSIRDMRYTPGSATAPLLLIVAIVLSRQVGRQRVAV